MQIIIKLTKHCIETEAKKEYEKLIRRYFDKKRFNDEKAFIESRIEPLKFFIEHADFSFLRSNFPELNGNNDLQIVLNIPKQFYKTKIFFNNKTIMPEWKENILTNENNNPG